MLSIGLGKLSLKVSDALNELVISLAELSLAHLLLLLGLLGELSLLRGTGNEATLERFGLGGSILTTEPGITRESGLVGAARREDIVLEELGLAGDSELERLALSAGNLVDAHNLIGIDVAGTLGGSTVSSTRVIGRVLRAVDNHLLGLLLGDDLIEADVTVTLTSKEDKVRVLIIERSNDTSRVVNGHVGEEGLREVLGIPNSILTLSTLTETNREDEIALAHVDGTTTLHTLVRVSLSGNR
jgi:hypothetical protein